MKTANYTFREGEQVAAFQVWPRDEESAFLHPQCAETLNENEFPLYADDLEEARCEEPIHCDKCDGIIIPAVDHPRVDQ